MSLTTEDDGIVVSSEEDTINLCKSLALSKEKHAKYKILLDSLMTSLPKTTLDKVLTEKMRDIILTNRCQSAIRLVDDESSQTKWSTLLGVDEEKHILSVQETKEIELSIQKVLTQKYSDISQQFKEITDQKLEDVMKSPEYNYPECKHMTEFLFEKYLNSLKDQLTILEDILKLRLEKLPNISTDKVNEFTVTSQVNVLKSKILEETIRIKVFYENKQTPSAYTKLFKNLINEKERYVREIEELKQLKNKYNSVSGSSKFKELLETYVAYQASIRKKRSVLDIINGIVE